MLGVILSVTVTVKLQTAVFALASIAVKVTVVTPIGYVPLASAVLLKSFNTAVAPVVTGAATVNTALHVAGSTVLDKLAGHAMANIETVQLKTILKLQVAVFPAASVAV